MRNYDSILSDSLSAIKISKLEPRATLLANKPWYGKIVDKGICICNFRAITMESSCGVKINIILFDKFTENSGVFNGTCQCRDCCISCLKERAFPVDSISTSDMAAARKIHHVFDETSIPPLEVESQLRELQLPKASVVALVFPGSDEELKILKHQMFRVTLIGKAS